MTIVYVDTEHDRILEHADRSPSHLAENVVGRDRFSTASEQPCEVRYFTAVSPTHIEQIAPSALVIGGILMNWAEFDYADLAGLFVTILACRTRHEVTAVAAEWRRLNADTAR
jgi:hypothetical protein